ncbi:hypothetical protein GTA08_BOTSDO08457 [Neofusicoccum parvum]|uniref:Uncharacterized protein n=1 Tax=Neofusicoccum parvum TaxID=310453 RepID=A0ACB5SQ43_9PEZI|nr:hypothetical protein GTA08_BOTSDO08457 [Neofusicoccum parvum]
MVLYAARPDSSSIDSAKEGTTDGGLTGPTSTNKPTFALIESRSVTNQVPSIEKSEEKVDIRTVNHIRALLHALHYGYRIVGLDVETYMNRSPHVVEKARDEHVDVKTELGITVSDPFSIPKSQSLDTAALILRLKARHIRVQQYAHICNKYKPHYPVGKIGYEEHFQFGETEYATFIKTGLMLQ